MERPPSSITPGRRWLLIAIYLGLLVTVQGNLEGSISSLTSLPARVRIIPMQLTFSGGGVEELQQSMFEAQGCSLPSELTPVNETFYIIDDDDPGQRTPGEYYTQWTFNVLFPTAPTATIRLKANQVMSDTGFPNEEASLTFGYREQELVTSNDAYIEATILLRPMIVADLTTATLAALRSAIAAVTRVPYEQVLISSAYNVPVDANFDPLLSVSFFLLLKKGSGESITPSIFAGVLDRLYGGEETILESMNTALFAFQLTFVSVESVSENQGFIPEPVTSATLLGMDLWVFVLVVVAGVSVIIASAIGLKKVCKRPPEAKLRPPPAAVYKEEKLADFIN